MYSIILYDFVKIRKTIKYGLIVTWLLVISISKGLAQTSKDTSDFPYYIEMMHNDTVNFYDVQKAFYKYYAKHRRIKTENANSEETEVVGEEENDGGYSLYKRWEYFMRRHINPDGSRIPTGNTFIEFNKYKAASAAKMGLNKQGITGTDSGDWVSIGPKSSPLNSVMSMGRINAIAFSPIKKGIIYAGSASGGLWESSDSGNHWIPVTDWIVNAGVSAIAFNPFDTSTIYIGTGDRDAGESSGLGVFKSTDDGKTWNQSNKGMGNVTVGKLIINPRNTKIVLAGTSNGVYLSVNGGINWTLTTTNGNFNDIAFKPGNPDIVFATSNGSFYRSANGGNSFSQITSGLNNASRGVISVSADDTNCVYFVTTADQTTFSACYLSTDGGKNFRTKSTTPNILGYNDDGSDNGGQAWYDLCIIADTGNAASLYVGGINVFHSSDSGATWKVIAHWEDPPVAHVHPDQHVFAIDPFTNYLYLGNDGGLVKSSDKGISWNDLSDGLIVGQIYKIGQSASRQDLMLAGFQDNSTSQLNNGRWIFENDGDGTACAIDPYDTMSQYDEDVQGLIWGSQIAMHRDPPNPTFTEVAPGTGAGSITEPGDWITPFEIGKINTNIMYAGYCSLWKCVDVKTKKPTWTIISSTVANPDSDFIETIDQSAADTGVLYFTRNDNKLFMTPHINNAIPIWTDLTASLPEKNSFVEDVKAHPKFPNTVYIIQNDLVYQSNDKGSTWINITGSLPNIIKNTIVLYPYSNSGIYIGTDAGVYYKDSTMSDWVPFYNGLALSAVVEHLEIYNDSTKTANSLIRAATFGRGAWESGLYSQVVPNVAFKIGRDSECINGNIFSFTDQSTISSGKIAKWHWDFGDATSSDLQNTTHSYSSPGTYYVNLTAVNSFGAADNISKTITVNPLPNVQWKQTRKGDSVVFHAIDSLLPANCYHWNFGNGDSANGHIISHLFPKDTSYHVVLKINAPTGCSNMVDSIINLNSSAIEITGADNFKMFAFPNPFSLSATVLYNLSKSSKVRIVLFDITGKQIAVLEDGTISSGQYSLEISAEKYHLTAGVYLLKFMTDDGYVSRQIVKF